MDPLPGRPTGLTGRQAAIHDSSTVRRRQADKVTSTIYTVTAATGGLNVEMIL